MYVVVKAPPSTSKILLKNWADCNTALFSDFIERNIAFIITVNFRFGDHDTLLLQTPQHWRTAHNWSPAKYIEALTEKNPAIKDSWFKGLTE